MKCPVCGKENINDYKFCHDCGSPAFNLDNVPLINNKLIIVGYVIAIFLGWGNFILSSIFGVRYGFISFIGLAFPGILLNSSDSKIRKHGYIQLAIMISGILTSFLVFI